MINLTSKVEKKKLIDIIKKNRIQHEKDYKEAMEVFKNDYLKELEEFKTNATKSVYLLRSRLTKPVEFLKEYDRAIRALELTTDKVIELDSIMFGCLVEDEWGWKSDFMNNTQVYLNKI